MPTTVLEKPIITTDLQEYTSLLNQKCIEFQELDKETISDVKAYEAYAIIKNMKVEDAGDALLYCASLNLLNTYVKQKDSKIGYVFKNDIHYMLSVLLNLDIQDVFIDCQSQTSLLVVQIFSIQFSFHFIKKNKELDELSDTYHCRELPWDGIRKQKCALTLFDLARKNKLRTCGITYRGKPLESKIARMLMLYHEGKATFDNL